MSDIRGSGPINYRVLGCKRCLGLGLDPYAVGSHLCPECSVSSEREPSRAEWDEIIAIDEPPPEDV